MLRCPSRSRFFYADVIVQSPLFQSKRSVADEASRPWSSDCRVQKQRHTFDRGKMNWIPGPMIEERQEVSGRMRQCDLQGPIICRAKANLAEICEADLC